MLLDIRTDNIAMFLSALTRCRAISSASLHGLIFAEAYGIPWSWVQLALNNDKTAEGRMKYEDFFLSVGESRSFSRRFIPNDTDPSDILRIIRESIFSHRDTRPSKPLVNLCDMLKNCPFCDQDKLKQALLHLSQSVELQYFQYGC
mmetsp:Transcript_15013/g.30973  ORF Transcript_15013/g.30973 Transcript_15013/m.30973 type:complete len:146 (-) Transcript_15013:1095-1532(-)